MKNNNTTHRIFDDDGLVKTFDEDGRVIEITFLRSGHSCTIEFIEPSDPSHANERIVQWSTAHRYRVWEEEGKTKFIQEAP